MEFNKSHAPKNRRWLFFSVAFFSVLFFGSFAGVFLFVHRNAPIMVKVGAASKETDTNTALTDTEQLVTSSPTTSVIATPRSTPRQTPTATASYEDISVLSSQLKSYLTGLGDNAGVVVYDTRKQTYYTYNENVPFIMASSVKVPIMMALFTQDEGKNEEPDADDASLMKIMIEQSDNNATNDLYTDIGDATGLSSYLNQIGVTGIVPMHGEWGYSTATPLAMANVLDNLFNATMLSSTDTNTAFVLLESVDADERNGLGDATADGANVAMKDGWVQEPDNLWAVNSSGILMWQDDSYVVTIYTKEQATEDAGKDILTAICKLLLPELN